MIERLGALLSELRDRRAARFLIAYVVGAWVSVQVVGFFVEQGYVGRRVLDVALFLVAVLFFVVLVLVWFHGEKGHQRVRGTEGGLLAILSVIGVFGAGWLATRETTVRVDPSLIFADLGDSSVAVLPFQNELTDPELGWLDRGVADLLATDLAQVETLRVVSGQRVVDLMRQLGEESSRVVPDHLRSQITQLAGARYMLTGRIAGSAGNVMLVASLQDVETGEIRAAARFQGPDVFGVVDNVSADSRADDLCDLL